MPTPADSPTPGVFLQRRLVEAGLIATVAGLIVHSMWESLPGARIGQTLVLGGLWIGLAWLLRRLPQLRMAESVALVGLVALVVMVGPLPVLATALLAAAAIAIGTAFVEDAATAFVVGCAVIAGLVGWLLPLPVHRVWVYAPLLLAVAWARRRPLQSSLRDAWRDWRNGVDAAPRIAAGTLLALGLASAGAWLPTLQYDDLAGHLALPWQLMRNGRYAPDVAQQVWSLSPWAGDALQGIAQVLARGEARGAVDAAWLIACAGLVARTAAQLAAPPALRWMAVALLATLPPVAMLVGGMQTELPATAAMLALLTLALSPGPRAWPAVGLLAGFLLGLKLLHVPAAALLGGFALLRSTQGRHARMVIALLLAALVGGSSYAYAWAACGNPVLPLMNAFFRSPCFAPVDFADPRWHPVPGLPLPWSMTFLTSRHTEGWDGGFGLLLVAFAGVALAALASQRTRVPMLCALAAIAVPMSLVAYVRYILPGLVLMLPPAVATIAAAYPLRRAIGLLVLVCIADLAFQANSGWTLRTGGIARALAAGGRDAPLFARYAPERLAIARLREIAPDAVVLDLGGASHAELAGRGRTTTWYAPALHSASKVADGDPTGAAWAALLHRERIDVVLLRVPDATPARRAGLARAGAHILLTAGPVECWALRPFPTP